MTPPADWERFLAATGADDHRVATALTQELMARGVLASRVILDVIAPAQHEVGMLWQRNRWTVAQEHAGSAVGDRVLESISPPVGSVSTAEQLDDVVVQLDWFLRVLGVALMLDDDDAFEEYTSWLREVLTNRGVPHNLLTASSWIVAEVLAAAGLQQAARVCSLATV